MSVTNLWLSEQLAMGHSRSMSRLIRGGKRSDEVKNLVEILEGMLPFED